MTLYIVTHHSNLTFLCDDPHHLDFFLVCLSVRSYLLALEGWCGTFVCQHSIKDLRAQFFLWLSSLRHLFRLFFLQTTLHTPFLWPCDGFVYCFCNLLFLVFNRSLVQCIWVLSPHTESLDRSFTALLVLTTHHGYTKFWWELSKRVFENSLKQNATKKDSFHGPVTWVAVEEPNPTASEL